MIVTRRNNKLIIEIQLNLKPVASKSNKSEIVASSRGFSPTSVKHKGKQVSVSVNAIIPK